MAGAVGDKKRKSYQSNSCAKVHLRDLYGKNISYSRRIFI